MGKYFGTDGIRGAANLTLDAPLAYRAGQAAGTVFAREGKRPLVVIGKDTRLSGDMLEAALTAGLTSAGADVVLLGVMPTPAVALVTVRLGADAGAVISASHNPFEDNGIKLFGGEGFKLPDAVEERIEAILDDPAQAAKKTGAEIGRILDRGALPFESYVNHVRSLAREDFSGLRVLIDCANGAASRTARAVFSGLNGLSFDLIHDQPDGVNINVDAGSTHMEPLCRRVKEGGYDLGIAFDGDADRCLIADERGEIMDGDRYMAICGRYLKERGRLKNDTIVATVMSNLGFHESCRRHGLKVECAAVGDRYVLERMQQGGHCLGGEQSGHIIFLEEETTGDGQVAAVYFLNVLAASGKTVSQLTADIPHYPQVLLNVRIEGGNTAKEAIMQSAALQEIIAREEAALGDAGRVLIRPSGTEPLIRVMTEAMDEESANGAARRIADLVRSL